MNCSKCGAPLTPVAGRDYLHCSFCLAYSFPRGADLCVDRVVPLGLTTETPCPRCDEPLALGALEGRHVKRCETCRGVLVPTADFGNLVQKRRHEYTGPARRPVPLNPDELRRRVDCPACAGAMEVHPYYGPGNVVIDSCRDCRLVWLDYGELAAIERAPGRR